MHLITFTLIAAVIFCVQGDQQYTTKWDDINLDEILRNDRLLNSYVKCLMDEGPCTPDCAELKKVMPDALETDCSKCTQKQKDGAEKVITFLIDNKPEIWARLEAKYDPEGVYRKKYEAKYSTTPKSD